MDWARLKERGEGEVGVYFPDDCCWLKILDAALGVRLPDRGIGMADESGSRLAD